MLASILAVTIFLAMFVLIVLDKIEHYLITLGCGLLTIIFVLGICLHSGQAIMEVLNVKSIFTTSFWHTVGQASEDSNGISWATIIFIAGMMVMVEGMKRAGFFTWLCMLIAKLVRYRIVPILITFMILSAFLSMFIASITVILFLAAVTVELSQLLKFNPVPMILAEVFCSNLGGTATVCGDPPNIIIGTSLGFSFFDFLTNTGVFVLISLVIMIVYFYLAFRKDLNNTKSFRSNYRQIRIYLQLCYFPAFCCSASYTDTDRADSCCDWCYNSYNHTDLFRQTWTGTFKED